MSTKDYMPDTAVTAVICLVRALDKAGALPTETFKTQLAAAGLTLNQLGENEKAEDLLRLIGKLFAFEKPPPTQPH